MLRYARRRLISIFPRMASVPSELLAFTRSVSFASFNTVDGIRLGRLELTSFSLLLISREAVPGGSFLRSVSFVRLVWRLGGPVGDHRSVKSVFVDGHHVRFHTDDAD